MAMPENPYEAPRAPLGGGTAVGVRSGRRADLRDVAVAQKGILVCILVQILVFVVQLVLGQGRVQGAQGAALGLGILSLVVGLVSTVFVFMLAIKVYNVGLGILFGVLALIPCIGLIVLLLINSKATKVLTQNGHKVGLLGANLAEFPKGG